jgi:hypothetical protein
VLQRGWSIGTHRVDLVVDARIFAVKVDGEAPPAVEQRSNLLGVWPFRVGDRVATLRRVRTIDVARNELWIDGVRVPHSVQPIPRKEAPPGASCKSHRGAAAYRGATAEVACGVCGTPLCAACTAVDGVRCAACFDGAAEKLRKDDRAKQMLGIVATITLIAAVALVGFVAESPKVLSCAVGMTGLLVFLLIHGAVRGRLEARAVAVRAAPRSSVATVRSE